MGEWFWFAAAGWPGLGESPGWLVRRAHAALTLVPCFPHSIDVCLAVWEQCLAQSCWAVLRVLGVSPRPSPACSARAIEREDVCVSGGTSPTAAGVEARESFWIRAPKAAVLRLGFFLEADRWCRFAW